MNTTAEQVQPQTPQKESRPVTVYRISYSAPGRRRIDFDCPFCNRHLQGFAWSLAGSGKRCDCGAKIQGMRAHCLMARKVV